VQAHTLLFSDLFLFTLLFTAAGCAGRVARSGADGDRAARDRFFFKRGQAHALLFTETKKQSPNTGARANNTVHTSQTPLSSHFCSQLRGARGALREAARTGIGLRETVSSLKEALEARAYALLFIDPFSSHSFCSFVCVTCFSLTVAGCAGRVARSGANGDRAAGDCFLFKRGAGGASSFGGAVRCTRIFMCCGRGGVCSVAGASMGVCGVAVGGWGGGGVCGRV